MPYHIKNNDIDIYFGFYKPLVEMPGIEPGSNV